MPRPAEGLVQAQASPTAVKPVTTGEPSTTRERMRSSTPAMTATPGWASASTQCPCAGKPCSTRSKQTGSRRFFSGTSREAPNTVTDHVSLSDGSVSSVTVPCATTGPMRHAGSGPEK